MRLPATTSLLAAALLAAAAPAVAQQPAPAAKARATPAAQADDGVRSEKGVRFRLPEGFSRVDRQEAEPGGDQDVVHVARRGALEVRVEVEDGLADCKELPDATPRSGKTAAGLETCEAEAGGPPVLGERVVERRGAQVAIQFGARHLSVLAFAPDRAAALRLAREVAATAAEDR
jgi:hypothetical protein